jgi:hypothetical protein
MGFSIYYRTGFKWFWMILEMRKRLMQFPLLSFSTIDWHNYTWQRERDLKPRSLAAHLFSRSMEFVLSGPPGAVLYHPVLFASRLQTRDIHIVSEARLVLTPTRSKEQYSCAQGIIAIDTS